MPAQEEKDLTLKDFLDEKGGEIFGKGEAAVLEQLRRRGFDRLVRMNETRVRLSNGAGAAIEMAKTPDGTCFGCYGLPKPVRHGVSNVLCQEYFKEAFGPDESAHPVVFYK